MPAECVKIQYVRFSGQLLVKNKTTWGVWMKEVLFIVIDSSLQVWPVTRQWCSWFFWVTIGSSPQAPPAGGGSEAVLQTSFYLLHPSQLLPALSINYKAKRKKNEDNKFLPSHRTIQSSLASGGKCPELCSVNRKKGAWELACLSSALPRPFLAQRKQPCLGHLWKCRWKQHCNRGGKIEAGHAELTDTAFLKPHNGYFVHSTYEEFETPTI